MVKIKEKNKNDKKIAQNKFLIGSQEVNKDMYNELYSFNPE